MSEAAELRLGPLLRYVGEDEATVWVETDRACEVEVLGCRTRTFHVAGHHYALVHVTGLAPESNNAYTVQLDGEIRWPEPDSQFPPSVIRTISRSQKNMRICFGSCRVAVPHRRPFTLTRDQDPDGHEIDALYALSKRMQTQEHDDWPHVLFLLGDQIYVDEGAPDTRRFIRSRRDTSITPHEEVLDFEEYTRLYWEAWGDPNIRWLFSTVSVSMLFDDHDVHDDWNVSASWLEEIEREPWWEERIVSALMSYWIYQHLGNLSPREVNEETIFNQVMEQDDAAPMLRRFAAAADENRDGARWSYSRDLGNNRFIALDSREGRVLDEDNRSMIDDVEWDWIKSKTVGDFDHLFLADTLPVLMLPAFHYIEAWNEAVCGGAWGSWAQGVSEKLRRAVDLEHWAAFQKSFQRMISLISAVGSGEHGRPPASISVLAGDVHHAYLARMAFPIRREVRSAAYQMVCSPFRNPLDKKERTFTRLGSSRAMELVARALARSAGVPLPRVRWTLAEPPTFDNQIATIEIEGRSATATIERTMPGDPENPRLHTSLRRRLS